MDKAVHKNISTLLKILLLLAFFLGLGHLGHIIKRKYFPEIVLYEVYHKKYTIFRSDAVVPIQAGRALKRDFGLALETEMIGDDTGDNISLKNDRYAELTAMYWIWKNVRDVDYVGIMHYRRFFINPYRETSCDKHNMLCRYGLTKASLKKLLPQYDIVIPNVSRQKDMTVYQQYIYNHYKEDIDMCLDYIIRKYPEMKESIEKGFKKTNRGYFNNLIIMRREIFDVYSAWLFDILFNLEEAHNPDLAATKTLGYLGKTEDDYQRRVEGFLAERLLTIWMYHNRHKYRVLEISKRVLPQFEEEKE